MKFIRNALTILIVCILGITFGMFIQNFLGSRWELAKFINYYPTPTDKQINKACEKLLRQGRASDLYAFYAEDVGDPKEAAFYVTGALQGTTDLKPWYVSQVTSYVWFERVYGSKGRQSPAAIQTVGGAAQDGDTPLSLADYTRIEANATLAVNRDMNVDLRSNYLTVVMLHARETNRRFVLRFGDAIDW